MFCNRCGAALESNSQFCQACGSSQPVGVPTAVGNTFPAPRRFSSLHIFAGIIIVAIGAVAGWFVLGNGNVGSPESVLNDFIEAVERQDQVAALEAIAPYERDYLVEYIPQIMEILEMDEDSRQYIKSTENVLKNFEIDFERMEYETKIDGDRARVRIVDGFVTASAADESESFTLPDDIEQDGPIDAKITMIKEDGRWYISITRTMGDAFIDQMEDDFR